MDEVAAYVLVTFVTVALLLIACSIGPAPPAKKTQ
jgi:hypothetical protein